MPRRRRNAWGRRGRRARRPRPAGNLKNPKCFAEGVANAAASTIVNEDVETPKRPSTNER
jgi:hypothetical protein